MIEQPRGSIRIKVRSWLTQSTSSIIIATLALFAIGPLVAPGSLSSTALTGMLPFAAVLAIVAVGQTLVIQQRGFDLSVPGMVSLGAVMVTNIPHDDASRLWLGIIAATLVPAFFGLASGLIITRLGAPSLIVTLSMNALLYGFVLRITGGTPIGATTNLNQFTLEKMFGIPNTVVLALLLIGAIAVVGDRALVGWRLLAMGVSPAAARVLGLRVATYETLAYAVAAALYGIAGALLAGYVQTPNIFIGDTYLVPSIAAVVLGGTALTGGRASVVASAVAALFLTQLNQIVLAAGLPTSTQLIVQSLAIVVVVALRQVAVWFLDARIVTARSLRAARGLVGTP
jgi:ribose transport system permease protein